MTSMSMKVLFQGDGTFSASIDALPLTVFTKMEDNAKSKMTLKRNISAPTKMTCSQMPSASQLYNPFLSLSVYRCNCTSGKDIEPCGS